ncbi:MAG: hypothetical protein ACSHW1_09185 [Yoonia sp.]|uniref:hypothetical protein n=1 Tax=Yoonia sp. TaxID=2212373 RepID=UPI003EF9045F
MSAPAIEMRNHKWGLASLVFGALALIVTIIVVFAGPFAPQHSVGTSIGQIIGEISSSAFKTVRGEELPPPQARPWDIDRVLMVTGPVLAVIAFVTAVVAAFRKDPWRLPTYGTVLGVAAITMQFVWWIAIIFAAVILLASIIEHGPSFLEF